MTVTCTSAKGIDEAWLESYLRQSGYWPLPLPDWMEEDPEDGDRHSLIERTSWALDPDEWQAMLDAWEHRHDRQQAA